MDDLQGKVIAAATDGACSGNPGPGGYGAVITTTEKSTITLNIKSDMNGSIHIHGYNIESELLKNKVTILEINLNATGSFPIALHTSHDHSSHGASHSGGQHNHGSDKEEHDEDIIGKLIVNPK